MGNPQTAPHKIPHIELKFSRTIIVNLILHWCNVISAIILTPNLGKNIIYCVFLYNNSTRLCFYNPSCCRGSFVTWRWPGVLRKLLKEPIFVLLMTSSHLMFHFWTLTVWLQIFFFKVKKELLALMLHLWHLSSDKLIYTAVVFCITPSYIAAWPIQTLRFWNGVKWSEANSFKLCCLTHTWRTLSQCRGNN